MKSMNVAMLSLVRTTALYQGQGCALEKLKDELLRAPSGDPPPSSAALQKRLRELAAEEGDRLVAQHADGRGMPQYQEFARHAGIGDSAGPDDDEELQMTERVSGQDYMCPIMKCELVEPMKIKSCWDIGAKRCVFSKVSITSLIQQAPGGREIAACPVSGCAYKGRVKLTDLAPCPELERAMKKAKLALERQQQKRGALALDVDDDMLDEDDNGVSQI